MKDSMSCDRYVRGLYGAMFFDIATHCPELQVDSERDYKRLLSAIDQRGLNFVFETLPAFAKHFDQCLANECLTLSHLAHFAPFKKGVAVPRLFKGLLLRIFDHFGVLRSNPDLYAIRAVRQLCLAVKRFKVACSDESTWKQVDEFFRIDDEVVHGSLNWNHGDFSSDGSGDLQFGDHLPSEPATELPFGDSSAVDSIILGTEWCQSIQWTADIISSEFGRFNPFEWSPRHGPGAVSDLRASHTFKYDFPYWPEKLESVFPYAEFAFANLGDWAEKVRSGLVHSDSHSEHPSRLLAVPKEYSKPRLIASEPTSYQWCQQVIRDYLTSRISCSSLRDTVHIRDQSFNQAAALRASIDGSLSTIDLSSASDRISCWLIERLFRKRPELLDAYYASRSRWITQDIDKKSPKHHVLRKFSTQGSAITFPTQSILFSVIAIGTLLHSRGKRVTIQNIRRASSEVLVFGDDIIVPTDVADKVVDALHYFRLKVNPAKTFRVGRFRESCGCDAFAGQDISRVSITSVPSVSKPETVMSSVDVHNNLLNAGWYSTAAYVKNAVDQLRRFSFPWTAALSGTVGWLSLFGESNSHLRKRWNPHLHREEFSCTLPQGSQQKTPTGSNSEMLQYFIEAKRYPESSSRLGISPLRHALKLRRVWVPSISWKVGRKTLKQIFDLA
ncbi:RNA-directed RNA polymerase, partial [ssRNA phage Zoerhiza.1_18]